MTAHLLLNPERESFIVLLNSFVRQKIDLNFNTLIYGQFTYQKMKLIKGKIPRPGFYPNSGQAGDIGEITYQFGFDGLFLGLPNDEVHQNQAKC